MAAGNSVSPPIRDHPSAPSSGSPSVSDDQHSTAGDDTSLIHADDSKKYQLLSEQVAEFPRNWLKYIEKIGDGSFGEVTCIYVLHRFAFISVKYRHCCRFQV